MLETDKKEILRDLDGVQYRPADDTQNLSAALEAEEALLAAGVSFEGVRDGEVPWLVAAQPFAPDGALAARIERLGQGIFALADTVQQLYSQGNPTVRDHLDIGLPDDLKGLDLSRGLELFRLDVVVQNNQPMVTELEELIGNVGKTHAFESAYGVSASPLFEAFAARDITRIWLDDQLPSYQSEMDLVRRRMKEEFDQDVTIDFFSAFRDDGRHGWRFCYTKDLIQYPPDTRERIVRGSDRITNPLFQGYGMKALLALCWSDDIEQELASGMGKELLAAVRMAMPRTNLLSSPLTEPEEEFLHQSRKKKVLKVAESPGHPQYTWGSRGVHFGESSAARWRQAVDAVRTGSVPGRPQVSGVRYIVSELVDSDRFDTAFLHPRHRRLCTMPRARLRLGPIFSREQDGPRLLGGHATFVNTSRKAHLGRHAVCAPIHFPDTTGR
ncbi:hypothetical protein [Streptomyces sp. NPDC057694]|uniref:hypothetical protein n=1 Tax=Streptomyces sp. NPDC057694 TaxID=3346216 RepID=UPI0036980BD2